MNDGNLVVAYHGCDITVRDDLVAGRTVADSSRNRYDWLGPGFYLFEADAERALDFARNSHANPGKRYTAKPIAEPAVVGCILCVQRCLDMTTRLGLREFEAALPAMITGIEKAGTRTPTNTAADDGDADVLLRKLDNAVFRFIHDTREGDTGTIHYQMVRGAFRQGPSLADNFGFHRDSHIQLALRDPSCIRGWFLRPGDVLMDAQREASARQALAEARKRHAKPRHKVG